MSKPVTTTHAAIAILALALLAAPEPTQAAAEAHPFICLNSDHRDPNHPDVPICDENPWNDIQTFKDGEEWAKHFYIGPKPEPKCARPLEFAKSIGVPPCKIFPDTEVSNGR